MKRTLCKTFIILFTSFINFYCNAQVHYFEKVPTKDGEVNLSVRQIIQDNSGFLWLATFSGLYRYEGDEFIIKHDFIKDEQINSDVTSLIVDKENKIWIGTNNGLSVYNPATEEIVTYLHDENISNSIGSNKIRSLGIDQSGQIYVGTFNAGLYLFHSESNGFLKVDFGAGVKSPAYIRTMLFEGDGKLWIGTLNDGLYSLKLKGTNAESVCNFRNEDPKNKLSYNNVYCLFKDNDSTIVAGTKEGLSFYNSKTNTYIKTIVTEFTSFNLTNFFRSILRDNKGKLWIGTWGGLFICKSFEDLENDNYELVTHKSNISHSVSSEQIMNIFQDNSEIVWIGTEDGLNKYDPYQNQFQPLGGELMNSLKEQTATDFCSFNDGILILTLTDGLLFKKDNKINHIYEKQLSGLLNDKLYSVLVDSNNNIWIGSFSGLLIKIREKDQSVNVFRHSSENIPIYCMRELENGLLLIGTGGGGLKHFNTKTEKFTLNPNLPEDGTINDIFIDSQKNLWVATPSGIFQKAANKKEFEYYLPDKPDEVLNPNIFLSIKETGKGEIMIGGRNGFYIYDKLSNTFKQKKFATSEQLWITNIQIDSEDNLWFNLNFNRIAKWDVKKDELLFFFVNNGIRTSAYNRRGFFINSDDELYISGFDEIFRFNTSAPIINTYSPKPVFTKLVINNTPVHAGTELNKQVILNLNIEIQKKIILSNRNKDFTLYFASTSFLNSRKNNYRYILHGYDNDWHTGTEKSAHYTNLNPGHYTFEVFSSNNDGYWSNTSAKLEIRVKPSPFLSIWAILAYVTIIFYTVLQVRRIVNTRIQLKRELLIEKVKRDKEEKFNQERLRFYTNISHELRTPLTLIMGPIKQLIGGETDSVTISRLHNLILNNSQRLLSLVNQLLDFRKSIYEGLKLKAVYSNIVEIIESNIDAFSFMAKEKSINVEFNVENKLIEGWVDIEKLDIILFNILSNAFKYTPERGLVKIELETGKAGNGLPFNHIRIIITNSGKGIPRNLQEKVFERFYQIKDDLNEAKLGTGIGLSLVKKLVELHHGKITLDSEPEKYTSFSVILPLEREAYSDEEVFDFKRDADRRTKELVGSLKAKRRQIRNTDKNGSISKVLIVEDNIDLRDFLTEYLSNEYIVFNTDNAKEGLEICKTENPELVISDVMMEGMDGFEFCAEIKSTPEISHIPVILMTAMASVENKIIGYKVGADDYITKPFEPELLKIRVHNILDNLSKIKKGFGQSITLSAKELTISKIDEDFIQKVVDLIEENIDNSDFDTDSFCKIIGVSSSQLYRKIKSITGLSPNEFLRTYRLKKAAVMIAETNLNISEIAYKVGFNDALYFSKCFKKQFGVTPSNYLNMS
ncbi:MAG: two-component regulator propeller domain-containing protein [Draconibacterium sp.]